VPELSNQNLISTNTTEPFITSAIDGNGNQLTNNGTTTSSSITFQFKKRAGTDFFLCGIDNQSAKGCTSSFQLNNLTMGDHIFILEPYVIAYDVFRLPSGTIIQEPGSSGLSAHPEAFHWRILS
jgi:hypothetical protein